MAKTNRKIIISCAISGSVHTPTMSEYLPITPSQIVDSAVEAAEAGASIVHLHARNGEDGRPSGDPAHFREICPALAERTSAIINITTGGSSNMTIEERLALLPDHLRHLQRLYSRPCGDSRHAWPSARDVGGAGKASRSSKLGVCLRRCVPTCR